MHLFESDNLELCVFKKQERNRTFHFLVEEHRSTSHSRRCDGCSWQNIQLSQRSY